MKSAHHQIRKSSGSIIKRPLLSSSEPDSVRKIIQTMQKVQMDTEEAKLNETSMSDNNGGRIKYKGKNKHNGKKRTSH